MGPFTVIIDFDILKQFLVRMVCTYEFFSESNFIEKEIIFRT
jgi:hypothetical protein